MSLCCAAAIAHPLDTLTLHEHCELPGSTVSQTSWTTKLQVQEYGKAQLALNNVAMIPACRVRPDTANCAPVSAQYAAR